MDLTLTKRGDYVLRTAIALARAPGGNRRMRTEDVCEEMRIPRSYAPRILGALARAGLATSKPGRGGGYRLSRPPAKVTLLDVVEAAEGQLAAKRCPVRGVPCRSDGTCDLHPTWARAMDAIRASLLWSTLADVVNGAEPTLTRAGSS